MRSQDQHLSAEELESLGREGGLSGELEDQLQQAREHAESCAACRRRLQVYPTSGAKLDQLRAPQGAKKAPDCPSIDVWLHLAGGLLSVAEQNRYTAHAATCDYCGPVLREVAKDFSDPVTEEEKSSLATLKSQDERSKQIGEIRVDLPQRIKTVPTPHRWFGLRGWQVAAAALIVCVGIALALFKFGVFGNQNTVASVNQLLAKAYTEQRTIEPRIAGAQYAPMRVERGQGESNLTKPPALLKAEALIGENLQKSPDDPAWLDARARADLLDGNYDSALMMIQRALKAQPDSTQLLIDLGSAYFLRAESAHLAIDYSNAIESLGKALSKAPDDPIGLFNRALACERAHLYTQAVDDLEHYLRIDTKGAWADEARRKLEELGKQIKAHQDGVSEPLVLPRSFAAIANDPSQVERIERRIEEYQDQALRVWLPNAFVETTMNSHEKSEMLTALHALSALLASRHRDRWLVDLLRNTESPGFREGVVSLRDAILSNDAGLADQALSQSLQAAHWFAKAKNRAGELRAENEEVHALRRLQEGDACLSRSSVMSTRLRHLEYPWIQTQLGIDQCSCLLMKGKFELARSYAIRATRAAQIGQYSTLALRAIGLGASVETDEGNVSEAWKENQKGLSLYWKEKYAPPLRAQQFYDDLMVSMEDVGDWNLALALSQESARAVSLTNDRASEATIRQHVATLAVRTGDLKLAAQEWEKASNLFAGLAEQNKKSGEYIYSRLDLAEAKIEQGKFPEAAATLDAVKSKLANISSFEISLIFYELYAAVMSRQLQPNRAEEAFQSAVAIADSNLQGIEDRTAGSSWEQEVSQLYRDLTGFELMQGRVAKAFAVWEWYRSTSLRRLNFSLQSFYPFSNADQFRTLGNQFRNETAISYALLPQGLSIWVFDNRGLWNRVVNGNPNEFVESLKSFSDICADHTSDLVRIKSRGRALYDLLIAPVADHLTANRTLVLEPDESFANFPFPALVTADGRYFDEVYRSIQTPGVLYHWYLPEPTVISPNDRAVVVGSTATRPLLGPVPGVVGEAKSVAQRFFNPKLIIESDATVQNVERALPKAEVFHFAGHALSHINEQGLLLFASSRDAPVQTVLWLPDRTKTVFGKGSKLVVLSACLTGPQFSNRLEMRGTLVKDILLAGVPSVVASRWSVDSEVTRQFMNSFYDALFRWHSVQSAIHAAAGALRENPETQHPYYWAAFGAFGRI